MRIFQSKTGTRLDAQPSGCRQKWIGSRLAFLVVAVCDNLMETMRQAVGLKMMIDVMAE